MENKEVEKSAGQNLHNELFGEDAKLTAFSENSQRSTKELVKEAERMIKGGHTYNILIPKLGIIYIDGVPFQPIRIKEKELRLKPVAGYCLHVDNKENRLKYGGYVDLDEREEEEDEDEEGQ